MKKQFFLGIIVLSFFLIQGDFSLSTAAEPLFSLYNPGSAFTIDYNNYGTFTGIGSSNYSYTITDVQGLSSAVGEGIYPDTNSIYQDPEYQRYLSEGRLKGSHWDFVNSDDPQADFYKWATAPESQGVRMFFMAQALVNAGLIEHALKTYYAIVVNFPKTPSYDPYGNFYWYVGPAAIDMINTLYRDYPELELKLVNGRIQVENADDLDLGNDIVTVTPGSFLSYARQDRMEEIAELSQLEIIQTRGTGKVQLVQYSNGHWQLRVDGKPFIIKGISYSPTKVGMGPKQHLAWQFLDENDNKKIDAPYDSWVDKNGNNQQDADELTVGDFQLLKEMGCNAIRLFHSAGPDNITYVPGDYNKELLRDMYETYGIRVIMGDFLGAYTIGSGATWGEGTDYTDPQQRKNMKNVVRQMVLDHKDEPYVLLWLLGNENNMAPDYTGVNAARTNAATYPQEYAEFLNEVAEMIHALDPNHPVAVGNLGLGLVEYYAQYAPELDILGTNWYPNKYGVGISYLREAKEKFDRPIFFPEYGTDAYHYEQGVNEEEQAEYHEGCWKAIAHNTAGNRGEGNVIGGVIFEWLDEWWKDNVSGDSYFNHQTKPQFFWGVFPDNWSHEEWLGICGQGDGSQSPFLRKLRRAYYSYKKMWTAPID